ncbi:flagellar hook-associated protein 2 [Lentibacillus salinarum]|uniref:Flagellar hook-associated protein 2 n=1 Tax=Lentibacillus salinarum TaxID=446820 RepID=A0ABW3ZTF1_9BACI
MRIGGLASGMDVDNLVNKLMEAERMPLQKMEQDQTKLTWKQDAFRDVNKTLAELDDMTLDMKKSSTYNSKSANSSQDNAVTATASSDADEGTFNIKVNKMATSAITMSQESLEMDEDSILSDEGVDSVSFTTYDSNGDPQEHSYTIGEKDTLNDVLEMITEDDNNVRAIYDPHSQKVAMETTRTGDYNTDGSEIDFDSSDAFFSSLKLTGAETGGTDAEFKYNGIEMTSHNNEYELGGVTYEFNDTTTGDGANVTVANDVEQSFESIMNFVDQYNEVVEKLNGTQQEEKFRDYPPLTEEQKNEMSEREIELWEEKAKSGILRGESSISGGLFSMRSSWYSEVETDGAYTSLTQIGITTTSNYLDGGKLEVDEQALKDALSNDPDSVHQLFSNGSEGDDRGVINRLEDSLDSTIGQIEQRAGKGTDTLENYTIGKRMKDLNERIASFEERMVQVENRYWSQFTEMEKAIQQMNQQSAQLQNQFGGGGMM